MIKTSIFDGNFELIHRCFGLAAGKNLKHKSICLGLSPQFVEQQAIAGLVGNLWDQVLSNWSGRIPSQANWRTERQVTIAPQNKSPEVVLERSIANMAERGVLSDWYNQVPVASGLIDGKADKRAAVDLVRVQGSQVDLVELKWGSDTPAFAAFEILQYGLAYLLCRDKQDVFGYQDKELLQAEHVSLQVLAPAAYYSAYNLGFLADGITRGLEHLCLERDDGFTMSFGFLKFPTDFRLPFASGRQVLQCTSEPVDTGANRSLIEAMNDLQPVWKTRDA